MSERKREMRGKSVKGAIQVIKERPKQRGNVRTPCCKSYEMRGKYYSVRGLHVNMSW